MKNTGTERTIVCQKCGTTNLAWRSKCEKCGENLHKDEPAIPAFSGRGLLFWGAFVLNLVVVGFNGFLAIFAPGYLMFMAAPALAILLCGKSTLAAGIVVIAGSVLPIAGEVRTFGSQYELRMNFNADTFFFASLPLLVSGFLLILDWWHTRRDDR